ncbi:MAG TPA: family 10 glycosylhydrolase, partial [Phycisphaeraceae bacterium]
MKYALWFTLALCVAALPAAAENLLKNPGFEEHDASGSSYPAHWTAKQHDALPLAFTPEHYEGKAAAMLVGDGQVHTWRQDVDHPSQKAWTLSAMVKAEGVRFGRDDHAYLYVHVIYEGRPYSDATHFYVRLDPGTYDWKRVSVSGAALQNAPIQKLHVSVTGRFQAGRIYVDDVSLTEKVSLLPASLLENKITDLMQGLDRIGEVDESVTAARQWLDKALAALHQPQPDLGAASSHWVSAAKSLSHQAWAAMYPDAMSDQPVEAQMIYHGISNTKEACDQYLRTIELAGCNGVYLSLGSWMSVIYHSDVLPVHEDWQQFDALTYFIDEAHRRGIKVFAYLATFYGTHKVEALPGSIAVEHPQWLAKGPDRNMPTFPDPANADVVDYMVKAYVELATRYQLDGIGLDYIRYPTPQSLNYDENNRQQVLSRYGIDILAHENLYGDPEAWAKVQQYRAQVIGQVVRRVHDAVKQARPDITIMACLISELDMAASQYGQNWAESAKWIDYASPMNYDDRSLNLDMLQAQKAVCQRQGALWIPAIGGMPEGVHQRWTISEWARRVAIQRRLG